MRGYVRAIVGYLEAADRGPVHLVVNQADVPARSARGIVEAYTERGDQSLWGQV
jgi:hypothetical protein